MWADETFSPSITARISDNTIVDSYLGINVRGAPTKTNVNFTISGNTVMGMGPSAHESGLHGIRITDGATGVVERNLISGFDYEGASETRGDPFAQGLIGFSGTFPTDLTPSPPVRVINNVFRDNHQHIVLFHADDWEIRNNRFEGTAPGHKAGAIYFSGDSISIAENRVENMPTGVVALGDDPDFGPLLGLASDAQISENVFETVETAVTIQPEATGTEERTVLAPFPEPQLDIATVVLITWPDFDEGYVLESSVTMDGGWTPLHQSPHRVSGRFRVVLPITQIHEFLRLRKP